MAHTPPQVEVLLLLLLLRVAVRILHQAEVLLRAVAPIHLQVEVQEAILAEVHRGVANHREEEADRIYHTDYYPGFF